MQLNLVLADLQRSVYNLCVTEFSLWLELIIFGDYTVLHLCWICWCNTFDLLCSILIGKYDICLLFWGLVYYADSNAFFVRNYNNYASNRCIFRRANQLCKSMLKLLFAGPMHVIVQYIQVIELLYVPYVLLPHDIGLSYIDVPVISYL